MPMNQPFNWIPKESTLSQYGYKTVSPLKSMYDFDIDEQRRKTYYKSVDDYNARKDLITDFYQGDYEDVEARKNLAEMMAYEIGGGDSSLYEKNIDAMMKAATGYDTNSKDYWGHVNNVFKSSGVSLMANLALAGLYMTGMNESDSLDFQRKKEQYIKWAKGNGSIYNKAKADEKVMGDYSGIKKLFSKMIVESSSQLPQMMVDLGIEGINWATGGLLTPLTGVARGLFSGMMEGGSTIMDMIEAGFDDDTIFAAATVVGLLNGTIEKYGDDVILSPWNKLFKGKEDVATKYIKKGIGRAIAERAGLFALDVLKGEATEVPTEVLQETISMSAYNIALEYEKEHGRMEDTLGYSKDDFAKALVEIAKTTALSTPLMTGTPSLITNLRGVGYDMKNIKATEFMTPTDKSRLVKSSDVEFVGKPKAKIDSSKLKENKSSPVQAVKIGNKYFVSNATDEQFAAKDNSKYVYVEENTRTMKDALGDGYEQELKDNTSKTFKVHLKYALATIQEAFKKGDLDAYEMLDKDMKHTDDYSECAYIATKAIDSETPVVIGISDEKKSHKAELIGYQAAAFGKQYFGITDPDVDDKVKASDTNGTPDITYESLKNQYEEREKENSKQEELKDKEIAKKLTSDELNQKNTIAKKKVDTTKTKKQKTLIDFLKTNVKVLGWNTFLDEDGNPTTEKDDAKYFAVEDAEGEISVYKVHNYDKIKQILDEGTPHAAEAAQKSEEALKVEKSNEIIGIEPKSGQQEPSGQLKTETENIPGEEKPTLIKTDNVPKSDDKPVEDKKTPIKKSATTVKMFDGFVNTLTEKYKKQNHPYAKDEALMTAYMAVGFANASNMSLDEFVNGRDLKFSHIKEFFKVSDNEITIADDANPASMIRGFAGLFLDTVVDEETVEKIKKEYKASNLSVIREQFAKDAEAYAYGHDVMNKNISSIFDKIISAIKAVVNLVYQDLSDDRKKLFDELLDFNIEETVKSSGKTVEETKKKTVKKGDTTPKMSLSEMRDLSGKSEEEITKAGFQSKSALDESIKKETERENKKRLAFDISKVKKKINEKIDTAKNSISIHKTRLDSGTITSEEYQTKTKNLQDLHAYAEKQLERFNKVDYSDYDKAKAELKDISESFGTTKSDPKSIDSSTDKAYEKDKVKIQSRADEMVSQLNGRLDWIIKKGSNDNVRSINELKKDISKVIDSFRDLKVKLEEGKISISDAYVELSKLTDEANDFVISKQEEKTVVKKQEEYKQTVNIVKKEKTNSNNKSNTVSYDEIEKYVKKEDFDTPTIEKPFKKNDAGLHIFDKNYIELLARHVGLGDVDAKLFAKIITSLTEKTQNSIIDRYINHAYLKDPSTPFIIGEKNLSNLNDSDSKRIYENEKIAGMYTWDGCIVLTKRYENRLLEIAIHETFHAITLNDFELRNDVFGRISEMAKKAISEKDTGGKNYKELSNYISSNWYAFNATQKDGTKLFTDADEVIKILSEYNNREIKSINDLNSADINVDEVISRLFTTWMHNDVEDDIHKTLSGIFKDLFSRFIANVESKFKNAITPKAMDDAFGIIFGITPGNQIEVRPNDGNTSYESQAQQVAENAAATELTKEQKMAKMDAERTPSTGIVLPPSILNIMSKINKSSGRPHKLANVLVGINNSIKVAIRKLEKMYDESSETWTDFEQAFVIAYDKALIYRKLAIQDIKALGPGEDFIKLKSLAKFTDSISELVVYNTLLSDKTLKMVPRVFGEISTESPSLSRQNIENLKDIQFDNLGKKDYELGVHQALTVAEKRYEAYKALTNKSNAEYAQLEKKEKQEIKKSLAENKRLYDILDDNSDNSKANEEIDSIIGGNMYYTISDVKTQSVDDQIKRSLSKYSFAMLSSNIKDLSSEFKEKFNKKVNSETMKEFSDFLKSKGLFDEILALNIDDEDKSYIIDNTVKRIIFTKESYNVMADKFAKLVGKADKILSDTKLSEDEKQKQLDSVASSINRAFFGKDGIITKLRSKDHDTGSHFSDKLIPALQGLFKKSSDVLGIKISGDDLYEYFRSSQSHKNVDAEVVIDIARLMVDKDGNPSAWYEDKKGNRYLNGIIPALCNYMHKENGKFYTLDHSWNADFDYVDVATSVYQTLGSKPISGAEMATSFTDDTFMQIAEALKSIDKDVALREAINIYSSGNKIESFFEYINKQVSSMQKEKTRLEKMLKDMSDKTFEEQLVEITHILNRFSFDKNKVINPDEKLIETLNAKYKTLKDKYNDLESLLGIKGDDDISIIESLNDALSNKTRAFNSLKSNASRRIEELNIALSNSETNPNIIRIETVRKLVNKVISSMRSDSSTGDARVDSQLNKIINMLERNVGDTLSFSEFFIGEYDNVGWLYYEFSQFLNDKGYIEIDDSTDDVKFTVLKGIKDASIAEIEKLSKEFNKVVAAGKENRKKENHERMVARENWANRIISDFNKLKGFTDNQKSSFINFINAYAAGNTKEANNFMGDFELMSKKIKRLNPSLYSFIFGGLDSEGNINSNSLNSKYNQEQRNTMERINGLNKVVAKAFTGDENNAKSITRKFDRLFKRSSSQLKSVSFKDIESKYNFKFAYAERDANNNSVVIKEGINVPAELEALSLFKANNERKIMIMQDRISNLRDQINDMRKLNKNNEHSKELAELASKLAGSEKALKVLENVGVPGSENVSEYSVQKHMGIYLALQQEAGLYRLLSNSAYERIVSNNISYEQLLGVFDYMNSDENAAVKTVAEYIQKDAASRYNEIAEILYRTENKLLTKEDRYFMLISDMQASDIGKETALGLFSDMIRQNVKKGFVYDRKYGSEGALNLNAIENYINAVYNQEHYIAMKEITDDIDYLFSNGNRVIDGDYQKSGTVQAAILYSMGDESGKAFINQLKKFNDNIKGRKTERDGISKLLLKIRSNYAVAKLFGSFTSCLQQLPTYILTAQKVGFINATKSLVDYLSDVNAISNKIYELSPQMKYRARLDTDTYRSMRSDYMSEFEKKINSKFGKDITGMIREKYTQTIDMGIGVIEFMDRHVANAMWWAYYNDAYNSNIEIKQKNNMTDAQYEAFCSDEATQSVMDISPSTNAKDNAAIYMSNDNKIRDWLLFTAQLNKQLNMLVDPFINIKENGFNKEAAMSALSTSLYMGLVLACASFISGNAWPTNDKDDDDLMEFLTNLFLKGVLEEGVGMLPIVGKDAQAVINGNAYADKGVSGDIVNFVKVIKKNKDERTPHQLGNAISYCATDAMDLVGLPSSFVQKIYRTTSRGNIGYMLNSNWAHFLGEDN